MRKLNVSIDMFENTKGKEKQKKEKKKKKEIGNVTMKYLSLSWQASICFAYFFLYSFFLSFFCFLCFLYSFFLSFVFFALEQGFIL